MVMVLLAVFTTAAVLLGVGMTLQNAIQKLLTPFMGVTKAQTVVHRIYRLLQLSAYVALFLASAQLFGWGFTIVSTIIITVVLFVIKSD